MKRVRIGFLLPHYSRNSKSHMPRVMEALSEWGVVVDVIHPAEGPVDVSTVRVDYDLYVLKKTSDLALASRGRCTLRVLRS